MASILFTFSSATFILNMLLHESKLHDRRGLLSASSPNCRCAHWSEQKKTARGPGHGLCGLKLALSDYFVQ